MESDKSGCGCGCLILLAGALIFANTCNKVQSMSNKVEDLENRLTPITSDVRDGPEPETFYDLSFGNRIYVRIDDKPVEEYCKSISVYSNTE